MKAGSFKERDFSPSRWVALQSSYVGNSRFFKILSVNMLVGYSETSHALFFSRQSFSSFRLLHVLVKDVWVS